MIALPSVHPEAAAGRSVPGEAAVAAWMADRLRHLGAAVRLHSLAAGRPSVVAILEPAARATATVILMPHLDTVGVDGMSVPPFQLTRGVDGRLHGRGACDTKGPTAALLAALASAAGARAILRGRTRWMVAASAGEEQGSLGAEALFADGLRGDFVVALEPTRLRVVRAAKGLLRVWIEVPGRAAHGAHPERGLNAVYRALPLAESIRVRLAPWLAACRDRLLGRGSVNLGVFRGGAEFNLVPDRCRLGLDIRLPPQLPAAKVVSRLRALIAEHCPSAKLTVHRSAPSFVTPVRNPWAERLRRAGRGWDAVDWFCDANIASAHGIPAVAFGPGDIRQAHTPDEYILGSELEAGEAAFRSFLCGA
ncbi:MAG TPA: M20/M25/M40 family metallo-hydrolase [Opitutaceae bacterium]|nr:M20/M25/M40 family metallo-hydrolase [Opitutaceae bacterium]